MRAPKAVLALRSSRYFSCIILLALFAAEFLSSCSSSSSRKNESADSTPESRQADVLEKKLLEATSRLLAVSKNENSKTYAQRRKTFDAALAEYLRIAGPQRRIELRAVHDSLTLVFPIQLVESGRLSSASARAAPFVLLGETVKAGLKGEILDLAWLPKNKDSPDQVIALFADSLLSLPWPNGGRVPSLGAVYRFNKKDSCFTRSSLPAGILALRDLNRDESPEVIALTSNMTAPVVLQQRQNQFNPITLAQLPPDQALPSSWEIEPGLDTFRSVFLVRQNFRSLRAFADRHVAMLDEMGYLKLFSEDTSKPIWKSERPWGNRLFLVPPDMLAVCDSRQSAFAVFRLTARGLLQPLGQSPRFNGAVSALLSMQLKNRNGALVSTVHADANGLPLSRLQFVPKDSLHWMLPVRLDEPRFPNGEANLTVLQEARENFLPDWHPQYPPMFSSNVFETLYDKDENGVPRPVLASALRADSTAKVWKINLRRDICFADGSPLTAEVVRQSWKQNWLFCKKNNCALQWLWTSLLGANEFVEGKNSDPEGLQVVDTYTLKVVLKEPRPLFIEHLAQPCFSVMKSNQDKPPLGTGPFQIVGVKKDQSGSVWQFQRNAYYHDGLPMLKEMKLVFHKAEVADILLNLGAAGAVVRRKKEVEYFRKVEKTGVRSFAAPTIYFLALNPSVKPLASLSQRRRVAEAINREEVATLINEAECTVATDFFNTLADNVSPAEADQPASSRALVIFFHDQDEVAQQIAERLAVCLSRLRIPYAAPKPLSSGALEQIRRSGKYDVLIDSYAPVFETPLYNFAQLLQRGYAVDSTMVSALNQALASPFANDVAVLEKTLIAQAVLYPLVRAQNYAVLPAEMEGARLLEAQRLDFAKAWLPRRR